MKAKLFGVPFVVWGLLCTILTIIWVFFYPSDTAVATDSVSFFILRWFHAVTWLLLALAAFIAAFNWVGGVATARRVAFLSLVTYLIFMGVFLTSR
jgi:hypothetical protein